MEIIYGVRQGSILVSPLFNIFLDDFFCILNDRYNANYANYDTPYIIADNIDYLIKSLEETSTALFQWFDDNILKNNSDKCYPQLSSNEDMAIHVSEYEIENSKCEKLLGAEPGFCFLLISVSTATIIYAKHGN